MKIKQLTLFTNNMADQKAFFKNALGFDITREQTTSFSLQVGWTSLQFKYSEQFHPYHYCFLLPANQLHEAIEWFKGRIDFLKLEGERVIAPFENWNAHGTYFYDGVGNVAEFIVRYDLANESKSDFDTSQILCVNEIGIATADVLATNAQLESELHSPFWKGNYERFGTNGTQEGLFIIVNKALKKTWYPTDLPTAVSPFEAVIEVGGLLYDLRFEGGELNILKHAEKAAK